MHHVRNSLLLLRNVRSGGGTVYAVTSANPGEGKTTVAIALAASFAQAGFRTALVDCDYVGRGLTREFGLDSASGLEETIGHQSMGEHLHGTQVDGLKVIPTGRVRVDDAHHLTLRDISPLIENLRNTQEIVIIDTGPILGSLEAGLVAQISDGVVLVAARGTSGRVVNAALERARQLCKNGVSLVFNRARADDLSTSASYSSVQSMRSVSQHAEPEERTDRGKLIRIIESSSQPSDSNGAAYRQ
jgi:capsular exopolysaccharide synthesis family protein